MEDKRFQTIVIVLAVISLFTLPYSLYLSEGYSSLSEDYHKLRDKYDELHHAVTYDYISYDEVHENYVDEWEYYRLEEDYKNLEQTLEEDYVHKDDIDDYIEDYYEY